VVVAAGSSVIVVVIFVVAAIAAAAAPSFASLSWRVSTSAAPASPEKHLNDSNSACCPAADTVYVASEGMAASVDVIRIWLLDQKKKKRSAFVVCSLCSLRLKEGSVRPERSLG